MDLFYVLVPTHIQQKSATLWGEIKKTEEICVFFFFQQPTYLL